MKSRKRHSNKSAIQINVTDSLRTQFSAHQQDAKMSERERALDAQQRLERSTERLAAAAQQAQQTTDVAAAILVDLDRPHLSPVYNVVSHLVYAAHKADVTTVLVNGAVVLENGRTTMVSEREAMSDVREVADRIRRRERPGRVGS